MKNVSYTCEEATREKQSGELLYLIFKMAKADAIFAGSTDDQKVLLYWLWKIWYHFYLLSNIAISIEELFWFSVYLFS